MSSTVPPMPDPQPSDRPQQSGTPADPYASPTTPPPATGPAVAPPYAPAPYGAAPTPYQAQAYGAGTAPAPYGAAPAPYGTPAPYGLPPQHSGTDGYAITSLVTGVGGFIIPFLLPLLAVGFGIAALRRIGRTGRDGKGMAIAGIVLGGLVTLASAAIILFVVALSGSEEFRESFSESYVESFNAAAGYEVGQCMDLPADSIDSAEVACNQPHHGEIVGVQVLTDASFPGEDNAYAMAEEVCLEAFADYVGIEFTESDLDMLYLYPTQASWSIGDRQIACWAENLDGTELTESVAGTAR